MRKRQTQGRAWIFFLPVVVSLGSLNGEDQLRYDWSEERSFVYRVKIVADEPEQVVTFQGLSEYSIDPKGMLSFRGGLKKSVAKKEKARDTSRGGAPWPAFMGPGGFGPGGPFTRMVSPFRGLEQTTNQLELNSQGHVISIKGTSQLPYLLGHLSLLPFERLDESGKRKWEFQSGLIVAQKQDRIEPFFSMGGPGSSFLSSSPEEGRKTSGAQVDSYQIVEENQDFFRVEKTSQLVTAAGKDGEQIKVEGEGAWIFDRKQGLPRSLDFVHEIVYSTKHQKLTLPISIEIQRLSEDEWTKILSEREAESKRLREAHEKRLA